MKNLVKLLSFAAIVAFFVSSCNTDPCKDVVCGDQGVCDEGICLCNTGYEKDSAVLCNTEWSAKFIGTNLATQDTCYGDNGNFSVAYNMTISRTSEKKLSTTNLGGFGATNTVDIDVTSSTDLTINHTDVGSRVFAGTGSISGNTITLNYTVTYTDTTVDTCVAIITK